MTYIGTTIFKLEVAQGDVTNNSIYNKFGGNNDVDTGSAPEDLWGSSGLYTGFDATSGQAVEVFSSSVADTGSLVSSGTATGGTATTLVDSGATFITDGVAVGDIILNDTQDFHGVVKEVSSETFLTVVKFVDGGLAKTTYIPVDTDSYRVVNASGTGAAVVKLTKLLDNDYLEYSEYVILNGATGVDTSGTSYIRNSRALVVLSGSNNGAQGDITGRQTTTTANVFWFITAGKEQTLVACDTVPAGKTLYITDMSCKMARSTGADGSANVEFSTRYVGGNVFNNKVDEYISDKSPFQTGEGYILPLPEKTDFKWGVSDVSDNNTQLSAQINGIISTN